MKKTKKNIGKSLLVNINPELYQLTKDYVKQNKMEYPSIKNFVENAIKKALGFKKYDIEGVDPTQMANKPLTSLVGESKGSFVNCKICKRGYYKLRENKNDSNICPNCTETLSNFVKFMAGEKK